MKTKVTVEQWIAMFRELGLDDKQMQSWHRIFELRYPDGHQSFLEWLGVPKSEIDRIRSAHR